MKRFRFPLQPVAVLRAHREARAREAFAAATQAMARAEQELAATRARLSGHEAALRAARAGVFSPSATAQAMAGYQRECALEAAAERAVAEARTALRQRREEFVDAHQKLEVVERLETRARGLHRAAANREEQAEFDDLASRRFARRRRAGVQDSTRVFA